MFGLNKNKDKEKNGGAISAAQSGQPGVILRTMQDDLEAFEGKITLKEENPSVGRPASNIQVEAKNYAPVPGAEGKVSSQMPQSSPFLDSVPIQANAAQKEDVAFLSPKNSAAAKNPTGEQSRNNLPWEEKARLAQTAGGKKFNWGKILIIALSIIIFIALGFGGYYFWKNRNQVNLESDNITPVVEQPPVEEPAPIEIPEVKFSADKPNYLVINTELVTSDQVGAFLRQKAEEIKESAIVKPVEFIVTDSNNNPMAFHIFAINAGLRLSSNTLLYLDEKFSLFYFNDQGNVRLGLAVDFKDKNNLTLELSKEEKTLADDIKLLFLGNFVSESQKTKSYSTGNLKNVPVRYLNLDMAQGISVDYALTGKQLIIGTSKNSMEAILDKVGQGT